MASSDHLNCYTGRIASFQEPKQLTKRRASSTKKKTATTVSWPHTAPSIEDLAQSGFYYSPTANHPDNVTCFMCKHKLDNWEPHDDPVIEHLALAPDCAWAICTSVYRRRLDENEDPMSEKMADARQVTFVEWPHEGKRGWKCNIKNMVEAGWCFDPSPEFDDGVSCFYCQLSLDGWESTDDPTEEHQRRSPGCPFFELLKVYGGARKAVKGKKGRASTASRASRLSVQSSKDFDTFSEAPSLMSLGDDAVHNEDSILTATQAGTMTMAKKGTGKGKAAAKGGKKNARSKKATEEPSAVAEMDTALEGTEEPLDLGDIEAKDEDSVMTTATNTSTASRTTRGRKASAKAKAPAKTTRKASRTTKKAVEPEPLVLEDPVQASLPADEYMSPAPPSARTTRNNSRLETSYLSPAIPSARTTRNTSKLEASYLEQNATEVEESELKLPKQRTTRGRKKMVVDDTTLMSTDVTQLPSEMQDEADKAAALAAEQELFKPKRGRKRTSDGVPKDDSVSVVIPAPKETKKRGKKAKQPEESPELPQDVQEPEPEPEPVAKPASKPKRGRKKQVVEESVVDAAEEEPQVAHSPQTRASTPAQDENEAPAEAEPSVVAPEPMPLKERTPAPRSPTQPPKEQTPSPSPQSSDAENKPPSTRPSATRPPLSARTPFSARTVRIPLAETTPRTSPSKHTNNNTIGSSGLRTALPWEPVDLENIFLQSPSTKRLMRGLGDTDTEDKENDEQEAAAGLDAAVQRVRRQLTSPEKRMTVEQWVQFQAEAGESRLRGECERMVGLFETASTRALRTLEGVEST